MDIRVLQYFLAVAREESITKAAETLRMTQPPLSRQLKDLEEELGKQLLIRGSKKITLTEDGMLLRKRAEELVDLMEKTKSELASSNENINGEIYIGCGETEAISFLAQAARNLQANHPLIHYHIYSGDAERVMERLDKGLIDFGLFVSHADINKYDSIKLPMKDTWGVLMRKDSPLAESNRMLSFRSVNTKNNTSPTFPIAIYLSSPTLCSKSYIFIIIRIIKYICCRFKRNFMFFFVRPLALEKLVNIQVSHCVGGIALCAIYKYF